MPELTKLDREIAEAGPGKEFFAGSSGPGYGEFGIFHVAIFSGLLHAVLRRGRDDELEAGSTD